MQLVMPALLQRAYIFICAHYCRRSEVQLSENTTKTQASMHPFKIGKLRIFGTEEFYGLSDIAEFTVTCSVSGINW